LIFIILCHFTNLNELPFDFLFFIDFFSDIYYFFLLTLGLILLLL